MGIFVAWMRAKALASGVGVAPKVKKNQRGVVLVEYLILAAGIFVTMAGIGNYATEISDGFSDLATFVAGLAP